MGNLIKGFEGIEKVKAYIVCVKPFNRCSRIKLRAIGSLIGKTVYWNEAEKIIELKETTVTDADVIIGVEKAKNIALAHAGIGADGVYGVPLLFLPLYGIMSLKEMICMENPVLWIVIPCYNEEAVLPVTAPMFLKKLTSLIADNKINENSKILFVNDGSKDFTWNIIKNLARDNCHFMGISQSRNRGHQNAVLAGLMEAKDRCDITISIDCDGQDDINAIDKMVEEYLNGCDVVYGVRSDRETDTFFKRFTAQSFYKLLKAMGADVVYNHADYRLISSKVLAEFASFKEVNIFLRGLIPLVGFKSTSVEYSRSERLAGESKYPLSKMLSLAFDGITSLSVKPIRLITGFGIFVAAVSFIIVVWAVISAFLGKTIAGWASMTSIISFMSGVQLISIGVIGEYIGKIYLETKQRPRYIISERTFEKEDK